MTGVQTCALPISFIILACLGLLDIKFVTIKAVIKLLFVITVALLLAVIIIGLLFNTAVGLLLIMVVDLLFITLAIKTLTIK